MKLSELNEITADNIGTAPLPVRIGAFVIVCVALVGVLYWKVSTPQLEKLQKAEKEEVTKREELDNKQRKAANLNALKEQLVEIKETFGELLKRLPDKTEIAGLLTDISLEGREAGLEFELFQPTAEKAVDYYAEQPITIRVRGKYHEFGTFISGVSDLPRIVTNHDIKIKLGEGGDLVMETTAKTYRYLSEDELQ